MMAFYNSGYRLQRLWRVQAWALERLMSFSGASGDIRLALMLLALRLSTALWARATTISTVGSERRKPGC
jgi:hypothetical protein